MLWKTLDNYFMNKDQKLLEEAYQSIYENVVEPLYFGPPERKQEFLDLLSMLDHEVHKDGSVSVNKDVELSNMQLKRIPFNFKEAKEDFYCNRNKLTSLEGAPENVGGIFYCTDNELTSLQGAPTKVGSHFYCSRNEITSLEGAPENIGGKFESNNFSDEDYRKNILHERKRKLLQKKVSKELDKEFDVDYLWAVG